MRGCYLNNLKETVTIVTNAPKDAVELYSNISIQSHVAFEKSLKRIKMMTFGNLINK